MKKFLLIASGAGLCSLLSASVSSAQDLTPDIGKAAALKNAGANVYGKITDTVLNGAVPLNYGTVTLLVAGAKDGIDQTIDSTGHFSFSGIKAGQYTLLVSYPGLADAKKEVSVAEGAVNMDLGAVYLKADFATDAGKEVKVTSFKEVIEQRPDGLVYKAENDFTNKGGNAADVLRKRLW